MPNRSRAAGPTHWCISPAWLFSALAARQREEDPREACDVPRTVKSGSSKRDFNYGSYKPMNTKYGSWWKPE